ncbi:MAG: hypothetical protein ACFFCI_01810 [Promethearchaeota archaeon]
MSKGDDFNMIISNWERKGTLEHKKQVLERFPQICIYCNNEKINYQNETNEEIIFQCDRCKKFFPMPFNPKELKLYYFF